MRTYGLIGNPLTHSFSKKYFEEKFKREEITDACYELFPLASIKELPEFIQSTKNLAGLNVTIPYKEAVMDYLHDADPLAAKVDAVNCIVIKNGKLKGYNTDVFGFENALRNFIRKEEFYNKEFKVYEMPPITGFVLGTGGSSKAVSYVLQQLDVPFHIVSRNTKNGVIAYNEIEQFLSDNNLFINTTPLGMFPETDNCPNIPYHKLTEHDFLFDLIYNPAETLFLKKGKQQGCKTENGLEMLKLQAEKSWEIWNREQATF